MPQLINEILCKPFPEPRKLYKILHRNGSSNPHSNQGLGKVFHEKTCQNYAYINNAFVFSHNNKVAEVYDPEQIYQLAQAYNPEVSAPIPGKEIKKNINKYALCLALFCKSVEEKKFKLLKSETRLLALIAKAWEELATLYQEKCVFAGEKFDRKHTDKPGTVFTYLKGKESSAKHALDCLHERNLARTTEPPRTREKSQSSIRSRSIAQLHRLQSLEVAHVLHSPSEEKKLEPLVVEPLVLPIPFLRRDPTAENPSPVSHLESLLQQMDAQKGISNKRKTFEAGLNELTFLELKFLALKMKSNDERFNELRASSCAGNNSTTWQYMRGAVKKYLLAKMDVDTVLNDPTLHQECKEILNDHRSRFFRVGSTKSYKAFEKQLLAKLRKD